MSEVRSEKGEVYHPHLVRKCTKDRVVSMVELADFDTSFAVSAMLDVWTLEEQALEISFISELM
jgi:hypothetical protein